MDRERLGGLEWAYLGLLDGHSASPVTLHAKLKDDPEFFVDVLGLVFRSKNESLDVEKEISEEERQSAQNAYALLRSWQDLPGRAGEDSMKKDSLTG